MKYLSTPLGVTVRPFVSHLTTDHLTIPAAFNEHKKNRSSTALRIFSRLPFFSGKRCKRRRKRQLELINDFLVCPRRWRGSERTGVAGREIVPLARKEKRARNKKGRRIIFVSFYLLAPAFYKIVFRLLSPPAPHLRFKWASPSHFYEGLGVVAFFWHCAGYLNIFTELKQCGIMRWERNTTRWCQLRKVL